MSNKSVDLTHPKIPNSRYSAFAHQVEMWVKRGWEVVTDGQPDPAPVGEKPAAKTAVKTATTPAIVPTDTPKES